MENKMAKVKKIHHIAIAAPDLNEALSFWRDNFGLELGKIEDIPVQKSEVAFMNLGDVEIELVRPTVEDSGTAKFLKDRGPGLHHICVEVDNIEEMLSELKGKGVRLINETPVELEGRKMAFIHPKSATGVLLELYQVISES
jgi:methylmalonyl-CoA/ethylmalonyl-CoA epimerase